jgi:hypothetical protein
MSDANTLPTTMRLAATPSSAIGTDLDPDKDEKQIMNLIEQKNQADRTIAHMKKQGIILIGILLVFFAVMIGSTTYAVSKSTENTAKVSGNDELVGRDGSTIVMTASPKEDAPLYLIPVLPTDVLKKMEALTLTIADPVLRSTGQPIPGNVNQTFKLDSFFQINSTYAVLGSATGDELKILNGYAGLTFGDSSVMSGSYPICGGTTTCARTQIAGLDLPRYMADAKAALLSIGVNTNTPERNSSATVCRSRRGQHGWGFTMTSDMRLKKNMKRIGTSASGIALWSWNYIAEVGYDPKVTFCGTMAQGLLGTHWSGAVGTSGPSPSGYYNVDYSQLPDVPFGPC